MPIPTYLVFDLETTGVDPATDRIVTAYVGTLDEDGAVISGQEWMIAPSGYTIPDEAARIHGITTEYAIANGRPAHEALLEIRAALAANDLPVVTHNGAYDFTMFAHELHRSGQGRVVEFIDGLDILDTFIIDKAIDPYREGKRTLTAIAALYGVALSEEEAHGAAADAIAAGRIARVIGACANLPAMSATERRRTQRSWYRQQQASFESYKRRTDPSFTLDPNWPLHAGARALAEQVEVPTF